MTYEDLVKANESIKTMTISRFDKKKGVEVSKEYAEVNQRIKAFRMVFPNGQIWNKAGILEEQSGGSRRKLEFLFVIGRDSGRYG